MCLTKIYTSPDAGAAVPIVDLLEPTRWLVGVVHAARLRANDEQLQLSSRVSGIFQAHLRLQKLVAKECGRLSAKSRETLVRLLWLVHDSPAVPTGVTAAKTGSDNNNNNEVSELLLQKAEEKTAV
jgi:hypothetical protein